MKEMKINKEISSSLKMALSIILIVSMLLLLRWYVLEPRVVEQRSMLPTLQEGDVILVSKLAYFLSDPGRGDIVILKSPNGSQDFVKRVIATPGDFVCIDGGKVFVNDIRIVEGIKDINSLPIPGSNTNKVFRGNKLSEDEFYIVGDNRDLSKDSRTFGAIQRDDILGKVFVVAWPVERFSIVD